MGSKDRPATEVSPHRSKRSWRKAPSPISCYFPLKIELRSKAVLHCRALNSMPSLSQRSSALARQLRDLGSKICEDDGIIVLAIQDRDIDIMHACIAHINKTPPISPYMNMYHYMLRWCFACVRLSFTWTRRHLLDPARTRMTQPRLRSTKAATHLITTYNVSVFFGLYLCSVIFI